MRNLLRQREVSTTCAVCVFFLRGIRLRVLLGSLAAIKANQPRGVLGGDPGCGIRSGMFFAQFLVVWIAAV